MNITEELPDYIVNRERYWIAEPPPGKNYYKIRNDNTTLDNFLIRISSQLGKKLWHFQVSGLFKEPSRGSSGNTYSFEKSYARKFFSENLENSKKYFIRLVLNQSECGFRECHGEWVRDYYYGAILPGVEEDYLLNTVKAYSWLKEILDTCTEGYVVSTFFGVVGSAAFPWKCYLYLTVYLVPTPFDVFHHCGVPGVTNFGGAYLDELANIFNQVAEQEDISAKELYSSQELRARIARTAENILRESKGAKRVGDAYVQETLLANFVREKYPDAIREYSPDWLARLRLDIFVPQLGLAIEYQGEQHYGPVEYWGGEEKFREQQERDETKRKLCSDNGLSLYEWRFDEPINREAVLAMLDGFKKVEGHTTIRR